MENENGIVKINRSGETSLANTTQKYFNKLALMYHNTTQIFDLAIDDRNGWQKIGNALNQCCLMIGSVSILSDEEWTVMKDFLITEYKDFSAEELLIAFKKVSSGSIQVKVDHYGKLSPMYLGAVLKAFRDVRNKALAEELRNKPKEPAKEPDMEEKQRIRRDYVSQCIIKPYIALKHGVNKFSRIDTNNLFKFLYKTKLIEPSAKELNEYKEKALGEMLDNAHKYSSGVKEKNLLKIEIIKIKNGNESKELGRVKQEAAHIYVIDWLKALSNSDGDLSEILKDSGFYEVQE
tara:strand:- start:475 stop:1350 length:876 start_codon:yes stop_codon:yes gene_type:complete